MRKAIAIDFDGCLCTDAFPAIGEPNWAIINRAKAEQQAGAGLILWTCREGQLLQEAVEACQGWGLTFDSVNESLPDWIEEFDTRPRKIGASEYWDDKATQMPAKLDRSGWAGCTACTTPCCELCAYQEAGRDDWPCNMCGDGFTQFRPVNYCSVCGRPLTEKAWAKLERRIGGEDGEAG